MCRCLVIWTRELGVFMCGNASITSHILLKVPIGALIHLRIWGNFKIYTYWIFVSLSSRPPPPPQQKREKKQQHMNWKVRERICGSFPILTMVYNDVFLRFCKKSNQLELDHKSFKVLFPYQTFMLWVCVSFLFSRMFHMLN